MQTDYVGLPEFSRGLHVHVYLLLLRMRVLWRGEAADLRILS